MAVARCHNYFSHYRSLRQATRHFAEMGMVGLSGRDFLWPITKIFIS